MRDIVPQQTYTHITIGAVSPDGKRVVLRHGQDGVHVGVWNLDTGERVSGFDLTGKAHRAFAVDPSFRTACIGFHTSSDAKFYDLATGKELVPGAKASEPPVPFTDADAKRIAALPAHEQIEAVCEELKKRNPKYDGQKFFRVEGEHVVAFQVKSDHIADISPVRAFPKLQRLEVDNVQFGNVGALVNLEPLRGTTITELLVRGNAITDLTPLKGLKLRLLWVSHNPVTDFSVLKELPLTDLGIGSDQLVDLSALKGLALTVLSVYGPKVTDLTPLKDMPLKTLTLDRVATDDLKPLTGMKLEIFGLIGTNVTDLAPLKGMPLREIGFIGAPLTDLSPLKDSPLAHVNIHQTKVKDLSPLTGKPLESLYMYESAVTDLAPLRDLPLKKLWLDYKPERDAAHLRAIKSLETINEKPAKEFLK